MVLLCIITFTCLVFYYEYYFHFLVIRNKFYFWLDFLWKYRTNKLFDPINITSTVDVNNIISAQIGPEINRENV